MVHDEDDPSCPLCEQNLSASRRRFLKNRLNVRAQLLTHQIARITRILTRLKALLVADHATIKTVDAIIQELTTRRARQEALEKEQKQTATHTQEVSTQCAALEKKRTELRAACAEKEKAIALREKEYDTLLAQDPDYKVARDQMTAIEERTKKSIYNTDAHRTDHAQLTELEKELRTYDQHSDEMHKQKPRQERIGTLCTELKTVAHDIAIQTKKVATYATLDTQEKELADAKKELAARTKKLESQRTALISERGGLEEQRAKFARLEKECKEQQRELCEIDEATCDYQAIATATGKDGIQALLIEESIPEIEHEANLLLSKLTDNQSHIFIESLRDLKSGGTKETLDIKISDTAGVRPYELFSGGEAFRIDFALRVAISKLLARRAGATLQTLIIDEGFGSQDEEGLSRIMDAIHQIQDDFAKIIVVSHLSALKEQFPVHFVVTKCAGNSNVVVVENG